MNERNDLDSAGSEKHQHLAFVTKDEVLAIGVLYIKEIIEYAVITKVPQMQRFIKGVTNIRGNVIPVVDLSDRLGLGSCEIDRRTCVISVEVKDGEDSLEIGLLVDAVNDVHDIFPSETEDAPSFGARIRKDFIRHMGKVDGKLIAVLHLENLLNIAEISKATHQTDL